VYAIVHDDCRHERQRAHEQLAGAPHAQPVCLLGPGNRVQRLQERWGEDGGGAIGQRHQPVRDEHDVDHLLQRHRTRGLLFTRTCFRSPTEGMRAG
jgi:hypothetical protein